MGVNRKLLPKRGKVQISGEDPAAVIDPETVPYNGIKVFADTSDRETIHGLGSISMLLKLSGPSPGCQECKMKFQHVLPCIDQFLLGRFTVVGSKSDTLAGPNKGKREKMPPNQKTGQQEQDDCGTKPARRLKELHGRHLRFCVLSYETIQKQKSSIGGGEVRQGISPGPNGPGEMMVRSA